MLSWWLRTSIRKEYGMRFSGRPVDKRHFCVLIYRKRCLAEAESDMSSILSRLMLLVYSDWNSQGRTEL